MRALVGLRAGENTSLVGAVASRLKACKESNIDLSDRVDLLRERIVELKSAKEETQKKMDELLPITGDNGVFDNNNV